MDLDNGYAVVDLEMTGEDHLAGLIIEIAAGDMFGQAAT